jgi:hypothetical protein
MTAVLGGGARHDDGVALTGPDLVVAAGAAVRLDRLVGLDQANVGGVVGVVGELVLRHRGGYPKKAQASRAATTRSAAATIVTSPRCFTRALNGL